MLSRELAKSGKDDSINIEAIQSFLESELTAIGKVLNCQQQTPLTAGERVASILGGDRQGKH